MTSSLRRERFSLNSLKSLTLFLKDWGFGFRPLSRESFVRITSNWGALAFLAADFLFYFQLPTGRQGLHMYGGTRFS